MPRTYTSRVPLVCEVCSMTVMLPPSILAQGRRCCSAKCMGIFKSRPTEAKCHGCGETYLTSPSKAAHRKYCTMECRLAHQKATIACIVCGKQRRVTPTQISQGARFCSWSCSHYHKIAHDPLPEPTSTELLLYATLDDLGITYVAQHRLPEARTIPDAYVPDRNLVIYTDGEYWHSLPKIVQRDQRQNKTLASLGYTVLRLPEVEFLKDPVGMLRAALHL